MTVTRPTHRTTSGSTSSSRRSTSSRDSTYFADGRRTSSSLSSRSRSHAASGAQSPSQLPRASSSHDEARSYYYGRHSNKWLFGGFSVRDTVGGAFKAIKRKVVG
ncbi:hypothetical protein Micbo1qcDRAFT_154956 [Microdochium bolleyi]|uniref:Uncharacterized protein n=1 Tax=Microdochium bolleyi TaxID=196109 RepID=A0A136JH24_9PEZI|nr:hypothetical protein Micbo1qcDRAFT_154956 [Microdochium bolleyi]